MSKLITARNLLNVGVDEFDPLNIDISEIRALSESLPKDGQIDINNCEILATKALRIADMCSELMAIVTCHVSKLDTAKRKAYAEAALIRATAAGIKTDKSKMLFAESDDEYIIAANKFSEAQAFLKWVNSKYESAVRVHYNAKKLLDRHYSHEQASSFNCSNDKMYEKNETWESTNQEEVQMDGEQEDNFGKEW